ncbi:MAG: hypothetical protein R3315_01110 [Woeseiaceae bacterium]|nr:hypothetical protein [Woeseiaceae bacterium]
MTRPMIAAIAAAACACVAVTFASVASNSGDEIRFTPASGTLSAGTHFTDDSGNVRQPSLAEREALSAAFQADLARLARHKKAPKRSWVADGGAQGAVVGVGHLRFLTVSESDDGDLHFRHGRMNERGIVDRAPAADWPEM